MSAPIAIAAGGTGGHFFPAEALGTELAARGHDLVLMTDRRHGKRETGCFATRPQYVLDGAGIAGKGALAKAMGALALWRGMRQARKALEDVRPSALIGFGGYPSVPPLMAARFIPRDRRPAIIIHEGNAVLGRANALIARHADAIATSFPLVAKLPKGAHVTLTGMPVRAQIAALHDVPYTPLQEAIRLLVWGGSLGARVFSDIVPDALAALPEGFRARLVVTQQVRAEDLERVRSAYGRIGIQATVAPFFDDVASLLKSAHLVIGRAGGSSVAEIALAGRPSLLVPLPIAASDEQGANASALQDAGGAWMIRQPDFTSQVLAGRLGALLSSSRRLAEAAAAARQFGRPDAVSHLADLVEATIASRPSPVPSPALTAAPDTP
jgi:UDP-N-acetylglucosamine--N-acetylmuramyl-(pentapeptide) pyrophosphoryl-undecaprenol N-acetylglucosamine transferase